MHFFQPSSSRQVSSHQLQSHTWNTNLAVQKWKLKQFIPLLFQGDSFLLCLLWNISSLEVKVTSMSPTLSWIIVGRWYPGIPGTISSLLSFLFAMCFKAMLKHLFFLGCSQVWFIWVDIIKFKTKKCILENLNFNWCPLNKLTLLAKYVTCFFTQDIIFLNNGCHDNNNLKCKGIQMSMET